MNSPSDVALDPPEGDDEEAVGRLARELGIPREAARRLAGLGHREAEQVRALPPEELARAGLEPPEIERIRAPAGRPDPGSDDLLTERLLSSVRPASPGRRRRVPAPRAGSSEVLRRWMEGDEGAMEDWIRATPPVVTVREPPPPPPEAGALGAPELLEAAPPPPAEAETAVPSPPPEQPLEGETAAMVIERERAVVGWLTDLLERARSDRFHPSELLEELQASTRQLHAERVRRTRAEEEAEQVKRGSIAVIKYVRSREAAAREQAVRDRDEEIAALQVRLLHAAEGDRGGAADAAAAAAPELEARLRQEFQERAAALAERETELKKRLAQAEGELRDIRAESGNLREREDLLRQQADTLPEVVAARLRELDVRERDVSARENDLHARFEEIKSASDQLERQREPLRFKEKQLGQWEVQLRTLKQTLEVEARTVERARVEVEQAGGTNPAERQRLEEMRTELAKREDGLAAREDQLKTEIQELQSRVAGQEAEAMHLGATADAREVRQPTGVRRLDDLLFGGLPAGSQVLLNGPAHSGKQLLARLFVAEGLKRGIPAIWVVTDKTYTQVRDEMVGLLPSYRELEGRGLVRYVDLYSRSVGVTQSESGVRLFQSTDRGVLEQLTQTVNTFAQELKERAPTYRLVFESVSTVTAYLDTTATFRFLQPFTGRRRLDGAVAYYLLETGMHSESDLETLEHMVDGSVNLKVEQLKTFLSIRGVADVQSRAWVGYTFTKRAFSLGSFSLDHIR